MWLALMLQRPAQPPILANAWASFSRSRALIYVTDTVSIAVSGRDDRNRKLEYKLRHSEVGLHQARTFETDSRNCPAARAVIDSMPTIPMPQLKTPGYAIEPPPVLDGATYTLNAPSTFSSGALRITSNVGSPLANWVDNALAKLAPCWKPVDDPA